MSTKICELQLLVVKDDWNEEIGNGTVINDEIKVCVIIGNIKEGNTRMEDKRPQAGC